MDKIQIENVRSLKDTGLISISPITLLVGTNSSGKSTFLRAFPLIKQSICKRTDGPLLWAGDVDDYVDFGSFSETVTNDGYSDSINFCFCFSIDCEIANQGVYYSYRVRDKLTKDLPGYIDSTYSIRISKAGRKEYVSQLKISLGVDCFVFDFDEKQKNTSIRVNNILLNSKNNTKTKMLLLRSFRYAVSADYNSIFGFQLPELGSCSFIVDLLNQVGKRKNLLLEQDSSEDEEYFAIRSSAMLISLMQYIGEFLCHGINLDDIRNIFITNLNSVDADMSTSAVEIIDELLSIPQQEQEVYTAGLKIIYFYGIFPYIDSYLNTYFRQVHYIAPLRATAERYYRLRNLAIDEVDYQGKNLAIFLNGLSRDRRASFQRWTEKYFGFRVFTKRDSGHLSVKVSLQNGHESINLSDTGFGYSQILPIITQLWDLSSRKIRPVGITGSHYYVKKDIPLVIAIEQPELHLHPALQAKLAKAFIASIHLARENGYRLQLLLETHSETIVNYFGRAISRGELEKKDVSVVVFNKELISNQTTVQTSNYDEDGYLSDNGWPIGFFSAED